MCCSLFWGNLFWGNLFWVEKSPCKGALLRESCIAHPHSTAMFDLRFYKSVAKYDYFAEHADEETVRVAIQENPDFFKEYLIGDGWMWYFYDDEQRMLILEKLQGLRKKDDRKEQYNNVIEKMNNNPRIRNIYVK
jgi:hypothetical protein